MRKIEGMIPTSYEQARALLGSNASKTLTKNTSLVFNGLIGRGDIHLKLHGTHVVTYREDGTMKLHSGGWQTVTTKARMNAAIAHTGCRVEQVKGAWQVRGLVTGVVISYFDGLVVGTVAR